MHIIQKVEHFPNLTDLLERWLEKKLDQHIAERRENSALAPGIWKRII